MALPATDVFTGTNGTQLTTYSANWTLNTGDFDIQNNALATDIGSNESGAYWDADAFNANQYAQAVTAGFPGGSPDTIGVGVRHHASAATYYGFYANPGVCQLFKMVAGAWTQLGSDGPAFAAGVTIRLEANGTTITPLKNGSGTGTPGAQTDSAIASGSAGVTGYDDGTGQRIDNWEGGDLAGAVVTHIPSAISSILRGRMAALVAR